MLSAAVLNIGLSILFGAIIFKDKPAFGVALGTAITDAILLITLLSLSWKESKHIVFNLNNLKIVILGLIIGVATYFISPLLIGSLQGMMSIQLSYLLDIVIMFVGSAIIYLIGLILLKEKLIRSMIHK